MRGRRPGKAHHRRWLIWLPNERQPLCLEWPVPVAEAFARGAARRYYGEWPLPPLTRVEPHQEDSESAAES